MALKMCLKAACLCIGFASLLMFSWAVHGMMNERDRIAVNVLSLALAFYVSLAVLVKLFFCASFCRPKLPEEGRDESDKKDTCTPPEEMDTNETEVCPDSDSSPSVELSSETSDDTCVVDDTCSVTPASPSEDEEEEEADNSEERSSAILEPLNQCTEPKKRTFLGKCRKLFKKMKPGKNSLTDEPSETEAKGTKPKKKTFLRKCRKLFKKLKKLRTIVGFRKTKVARLLQAQIDGLMEYAVLPATRDTSTQTSESPKHDVQTQTLEPEKNSIGTQTLEPEKNSTETQTFEPERNSTETERNSIDETRSEIHHIETEEEPSEAEEFTDCLITMGFGDYIDYSDEEDEDDDEEEEA